MAKLGVFDISRNGWKGRKRRKSGKSGTGWEGGPRQADEGGGGVCIFIYFIYFYFLICSFLDSSSPLLGLPFVFIVEVSCLCMFIALFCFSIFICALCQLHVQGHSHSRFRVLSGSNVQTRSVSVVSSLHPDVVFVRSAFIYYSSEQIEGYSMHIGMCRAELVIYQVLVLRPGPGATWHP